MSRLRALQDQLQREGHRLAANGFALEAQAARRISAVTGEDAASPADYPRLIWVSDEAPARALPLTAAGAQVRLPPRQSPMGY